MAKRNFKNINVSKDFYFNWFEPTRKRINKNWSQTKFTEYIYRSGAKLVIPKKKDIFGKSKGGWLI